MLVNLCEHGLYLTMGEVSKHEAIEFEPCESQDGVLDEIGRATKIRTRVRWTGLHMQHTSHHSMFIMHFKFTAPHITLTESPDSPLYFSINHTDCTGFKKGKVVLVDKPPVDSDCGQ